MMVFDIDESINNALGKPFGGEVLHRYTVPIPSGIVPAGSKMPSYGRTLSAKERDKRKAKRKAQRTARKRRR